MKKDTEVKLLMQERRKGTSQRLAAARAGMSERTARKYEKAGQLPSQLKRPHTWASCNNSASYLRWGEVAVLLSSFPSERRGAR